MMIWLRGTTHHFSLLCLLGLLRAIFSFHSIRSLNEDCFKYQPKHAKLKTVHRCLILPDGFFRKKDSDGKLLDRPSKPKKPILVKDVSELKELISEGYQVQDLDVRGDTRISPDEAEYSRGLFETHPVVQALYKRVHDGSVPGNRTDNRKIAIAIEGGGMRGCVGAGMITAISYLGLESAVDVIYGSSAGSLVGAYFIAKQLPYIGPEVYYDVLTTAGKEFIDTQAILRSAGLGIFDLRLKSFLNLFRDRMGEPVLNLNYVFDKIVQRIKPLDWKVFWEQQEQSKIELKVVASGLLSRKAVVMSAKNKNFQTISELCECMKASMLLPGITGDVIRLKGTQASGENIAKTWWREYTTRTNSQLLLGSEPMSDALVFEPVPYRSAIRENCSHVIVLRTRADDQSVTVRMSILEKMILSRFFGRKQNLPDIVDWMINQYHKLIYAEDVLILNAANRDYNQTSPGTKLFCIALPKGIPEVSRMETSRVIIFNSVRQGFAAAYDSLVTDPTKKGQGWEVAKSIWPDSILENPPKHLGPKEAEEYRSKYLTPLSQQNKSSFHLNSSVENSSFPLEISTDATATVAAAAMAAESYVNITEMLRNVVNKTDAEGLGGLSSEQLNESMDTSLNFNVFTQTLRNLNRNDSIWIESNPSRESLERLNNTIRDDTDDDNGNGFVLNPIVSSIQLAASKLAAKVATDAYSNITRLMKTYNENKTMIVDSNVEEVDNLLNKMLDPSKYINFIESLSKNSFIRSALNVKKMEVMINSTDLVGGNLHNSTKEENLKVSSDVIQEAFLTPEAKPLPIPQIEDLVLRLKQLQSMFTGSK